MTTRKSLDALGARTSVEYNPPLGEHWKPWDLASYTEEHEDGSLVAQPSTEILVRADDVGLLYPGRTHDLHGPPESGKSWVALLPVRDVLNLGGRALFLDYEDAGPEEITDRLRRLGVPMDAIFEGLSYVQPQGPPVGAEWEHLVYQPYGVAVIDAANGALAEMQRDSSSNADVAVWAKATVLPLVEGDTPVIVVEHPPHGSKRAIGAVAKKGSLTGASYRVEASTPLVPGAVGVIDLYVAKDRAGTVRKNSVRRTSDGSQHAARITFDATNEHKIVVAVDAPRPAKAADPAGRAEFLPDEMGGLRERISRIVEDAPGPMSQNRLAKAVGGDRNDARAQIHRLVDDGYLVAEKGRNNALMHRSVRAYRLDGS